MPRPLVIKLIRRPIVAGEGMGMLVDQAVVVVIQRHGEFHRAAGRIPHRFRECLIAGSCEVSMQHLHVLRAVQRMLTVIPRIAQARRRAKRKRHLAATQLIMGERLQRALLKPRKQQQMGPMSVLAADHRLHDRTATHAFRVREKAAWPVPAIGAMLVDPDGVLRVAVERLHKRVGKPIRLGVVRSRGCHASVTAKESMRDSSQETARLRSHL